MQYSTRLAIPSPQDADVPDFPAHLAARAAILDKAAITDHGPLSNRPVSTVVSPGIKGRRYYAEDTAEEFLDTGTAWVRMQAGAGVRADTIAPLTASTTTLRVSGGTTAAGAATAGRTELWDRISVSGAHGFGSFPDAGAGGIYAAGRISTEAPLATNNDTGLVTNRLGSPKNTVSLALGTQESTSAYLVTDYSAAIRFGGAGVAYGDFAYYPMATDGHFKLWRSPSAVGTTLADLRIQKLITAGGIDVLGDNIHLQGGFGSGHLYFGPTSTTRLFAPSAGLLRTPGRLQTGASDATALDVPGGVENLRIIRGAVNGDGTIARGQGFTVVKNAGNGNYTITFTDTFGDIPVVTVSARPGADNSSAFIIDAEAAGSVTIRNSTQVSNAFNFIAVGTR